MSGWQDETGDKSGQTLATYVWGRYIDELVSMRRCPPGQTPVGSNLCSGGLPPVDSYFHRDDNYNVIAATDAFGHVVERYDYDDFGRPWFLTPAGAPATHACPASPAGACSAVGNPYLFTGREYDPETGLYYYRTRYYDPVTGRFFIPDVVGPWGDFWSLGNAFAYVKNNPFTRLDPTGHGALDWVQTGLDAAGFIPGVGAIPDLANAAISAIRGDWSGAALNAIAAVPIAGDAAKAGKMVGTGVEKVLKHVDDVGDLARSTGRSADEIAGAGKAGGAGSGSGSGATGGGAAGGSGAGGAGGPGAGIGAAGAAPGGSGGGAGSSVGRGRNPKKPNGSNPGDDLPTLDNTGKVHGELPSARDLGKYSRDDLEGLLAELRQSVQKRIEENSRFPRHKPHGERQSAEQQLIKQIEKYLRDCR